MAASSSPVPNYDRLGRSRKEGWSLAGGEEGGAEPEGSGVGGAITNTPAKRTEFCFSSKSTVRPSEPPNLNKTDLATCSNDGQSDRHPGTMKIVRCYLL